MWTIKMLETSLGKKRDIYKYSDWKMWTIEIFRNKSGKKNKMLQKKIVVNSWL